MNSEASPSTASPEIVEAVSPETGPIAEAKPATDHPEHPAAGVTREPTAVETGLGTPVKEAIGFIAGFTALSYVFGFLCINSYLSSHGVIIFSAVSSEYLAAGLCFGFFYVVAAIIVQVTSRQELPSEIWWLMLKKREEKLLEVQASGMSQAYARGYAPAFAITFMVTALIKILLTQVRDYLLILVFVTSVCYLSTHSFQAFSSLEFYAWIILVPLGVSLLIDFARQTAAWKWRLLPFVLVTLLLSAVFYGRGLYPYISSSIGGGTPVAVRFVIDPTNKANSEAALNIKIESNTTPPLRLLLETSDSLVVMVKPNGRPDQIVQFKKDQVKAVVYGLMK